MADIMVLAEHTAEVAAAEEDGSRAMVALNTRLLAKVRGNGADAHSVALDETGASALEAIHTTTTGAEIAVREVSVGGGAFAGGVWGGQRLVAGDVRIVEKEGWGQMEEAALACQGIVGCGSTAWPNWPKQIAETTLA